MEVTASQPASHEGWVCLFAAKREGVTSRVLVLSSAWGVLATALGNLDAFAFSRVARLQGKGGETE